MPTSTGNYGRACAAPFTCHKRRHTITNKPCKCVDGGRCHTCDYTSRGHVCTKCKAGSFLHEGSCVAKCPDGLTHYGFSQYGRACQAPFTCKSGADTETGDKCTCKHPSSKKHCHTCHWKVCFGGRSARHSCSLGVACRTASPGLLPCPSQLRAHTQSGCRRQTTITKTPFAVAVGTADTCWTASVSPNAQRASPPTWFPVSLDESAWHCSWIGHAKKEANTTASRLGLPYTLCGAELG